MKKENISNAITNIDITYVEHAANYEVANKCRQSLWMRWGAIAACLCLCVAIGFGIWYRSSDVDDNPILRPLHNHVYTEQYIYRIDEGQFSTYVGGKVIEEEKIGGKIADVSLTAGWKKVTGNEWITQEKLRGEIYSINGIANDVAVALKFIDKGDAVTTTHYYVIINPNADLSIVEKYIIFSAFSNNNIEL